MQRSANDGRWGQQSGESDRFSHPDNWLIRLPRNSTRALSAAIGQKAPVQPVPTPVTKYLEHKIGRVSDFCTVLIARLAFLGAGSSAPVYS